MLEELEPIEAAMAAIRFSQQSHQPAAVVVAVMVQDSAMETQVALVVEQEQIQVLLVVLAISVATRQ